MESPSKTTHWQPRSPHSSTAFQRAVASAIVGVSDIGNNRGASRSDFPLIVQQHCPNSHGLRRRAQCDVPVHLDSARVRRLPMLYSRPRLMMLTRRLISRPIEACERANINCLGSVFLKIAIWKYRKSVFSNRR
jgi:hypothetical protein